MFDEIIDEKEFPLFSNSYLLVVGSSSSASSVSPRQNSNDSPFWTSPRITSHLLMSIYMHWLYYNEDTYAVSNFDFIFPNILVDGKQWHVIDYEWTFDKHIEVKDIAFRAFFNYTLGGACFVFNRCL